VIHVHEKVRFFREFVKIFHVMKSENYKDKCDRVKGDPPPFQTPYM